MLVYCWHGTQIDTGACAWFDRQIIIDRTVCAERRSVLQGVNVTALREIKLLQELKHSNIIALLDVFPHKHNLHLVRMTNVSAANIPWLSQGASWCPQLASLTRCLLRPPVLPLPRADGAWRRAHACSAGRPGGQVSRLAFRFSNTWRRTWKRSSKQRSCTSGRPTLSPSCKWSLERCCPGHASAASQRKPSRMRRLPPCVASRHTGGTGPLRLYVACALALCTLSLNLARASRRQQQQ